MGQMTMMEGLLWGLLPMVGYGICGIGMMVMAMIVWLRWNFRRARMEYHDRNASETQNELKIKKVIGFFHPRCAAGGGGERVLWKAMDALEPLLQKKSSSNEYYYRIVIFSMDAYHDTYKEDLIKHVKERFDIELPTNLDWSVVHLENIQEHQLKSAKRWTMFMDSYRDMCWAWQALVQHDIDVFVDTTGCAFTFAVVKWIVARHIRVTAYVHYPTISTDMLQLVFQRRPTYNNNSLVAQSSLITYVKLLYYATFALAYGIMGSLADCVMVNSTWTYNHIRYIWRGLSSTNLSIVYPPCDVPDTMQDTATLHKRNNWILSIAQFRPEKDHALQLRSFSKYIELFENNAKNSESKVDDVQLILMGSCRNQQDEARVQQLKQLAKELNVHHRVQFICNASYATLQHYMKQKATVGLHTMWNEHFGIGVVEMMASGLITIAHDSGGPASDIITPHKDGYLASTEKQYADAIHLALQNGQPNSPTNQSIRQQAMKSVQRFSNSQFITNFQKAIQQSNILTNN